MITKSKIAAVLAALTVAASLTIPTAAQAGPKWGGHKWGGVAAGIAGGVLLGAAIANSEAYAEPVEPAYAEDYRSCRLVRQYNASGFYVGTVRSCNY